MIINAQTLETVHAYAREHLTGIGEIKRVINADNPRRFSVGVRIGIAYYPERGTHAYRLACAQLFGALAAHHVPLTAEISAIKEALTASYSRALESSLAYGERAAKGTWARDGRYLGAVLSREESARFGESHVWDWLLSDHDRAAIAATIPAPPRTPTTMEGNSIMSAWQTVRTETTPDGHTIEMRYAEFGKGRAKIRKWEIFRDGAYAGYAATEQDAEVNFGRVLSGYVRDVETGNYVKAPATPAAPAPGGLLASLLADENDKLRATLAEKPAPPA